MHGKAYEVLSIEKGWYRIVDEAHEDYLYSSEEIETVEPDDGTVSVKEQPHNVLGWAAGLGRWLASPSRLLPSYYAARSAESVPLGGRADDQRC